MFFPTCLSGVFFDPAKIQVGMVIGGKLHILYVLERFLRIVALIFHGGHLGDRVGDR